MKYISEENPIINKIFNNRNIYYGVVPALFYFFWLLYKRFGPYTYDDYFSIFIPYIGILLILIFFSPLSKIKKENFYDFISLVIPSLFADILFWIINWIFFIISPNFSLLDWGIFEFIIATVLFLSISIIVLSVIAIILYWIDRAVKLLRRIKSHEGL
jgi:hypothetical protein